MAPGKRLDVLKDGLLHYATRLRCRFGPALKMKMTRANKLLSQCKSDLDEMCKSFSVSCTDALIEGWIEEESLSFQPKEQELYWDEQYVGYLLAITNLRHTISVGGAEEKADTLRKQLDRNENCAKRMESKNGVKKRWELKSIAAENAIQRSKSKKRNSILSQLHRLSSERTFLLEMKRKYADGQAVAIKLSREISKVVANMNKLLDQLNGSDARTEDHEEKTFEEIKDPKSMIYAYVDCGDTSCSTSSIPISAKSRFIKLYCLKKRSEEETTLLINEVSRFVAFLESELHKIDYHTSRESNGLKNHLLSKRACIVQELAGLQRLWSNEVDFREDYELLLTRTLNCSQDYVLSLLEEDVNTLDQSVDFDSDVDDEIVD